MFQDNWNFILTREQRQRPFLSSQFSIFIYGFSALYKALSRLASNRRKILWLFCTTPLRFSMSLMRVWCSFSIKVSLNQIQKSSGWFWPNCLTMKHPHVLFRGTQDIHIRNVIKYCKQKSATYCFSVFLVLKILTNVFI